MLDALVQWQKIDPSNGLVFPWLVSDALDFISTWDLSDKSILEYGSGASTLWFADKAKSVVSVDSNRQWHEDVERSLKEKENVCLVLAEVNEGDLGNADKYVKVPMVHYDIVLVDGILRYECIEYALTLPRPTTLIVDNWQQSYVFMCPKAEELLKGFESRIFEQSDHTDNDGVNKWKTAIFYLR